MLKSILIAALFLAPSAAIGKANDFVLISPKGLEDNGFLQFLLPRFSLKMHIRPRVVFTNGPAQASLNTQSGIPVMQGLGETYFLRLDPSDSLKAGNAQKFADWLVSDIGKRTIKQFVIDGKVVFRPVAAVAETVDEVLFNGNIALGETLSYTKCGRCHVIGDKNRMNGIGSTPSFGVLRGLPDWRERFQTFYLRVPHPSIIQVKGVSAAFSQSSPPANIPIHLTVDQVEDILTYITTVEPVDLGAPLVQN